MESAIKEIKGRIDTLNRQIEYAEDEAARYDRLAAQERESANKSRHLRDSYADFLLLARPSPSKDAD